MLTTGAIRPAKTRFPELRGQLPESRSFKQSQFEIALEFAERRVHAPRAVTVRPYRSTDFDRYVELDIETGLAGRSFDEAQSQAFAKRWPEILRERFGFGPDGPAPEHGQLYVLEDEGAYAGHIWLTDKDDLLTGERRLFVTTVAVVESARGRGIGKQLLDFAEREARRRGIATIALGVVAGNLGAVRLYERLGYGVEKLSMTKSVRS